MLTYDLTGKTALITGAATGIGRATAQSLARAGARVAINFLPDDPRGAKTVADLAADGDVIAAPGDVSDAQSAASMVETAVGQLDRLDLLVNNAGTPGGRKEIPPTELDLITEEVLRRFKWIPDQISIAMASKGGRAAGSPQPHG